MNQQLFSTGVATLAGALSNSGTTVALTTGTGASFPVLANGDYFLATLSTAASPLVPVEVVKVTAISGDTITTMVRQYEGTATAFSAGDNFQIRISKTPLNKIVFADAPKAMVNTAVNLGSQVLSETFSRSRAKKIAVAANTSDMKVAFIGDSTTAGVHALSASDAGTGCRAVCVPTVLSTLINKIGQPCNSDSFFGDQNFQPSGITPNAYDPRITLGTGWAVYTGTTVFSLGARAITTSTATGALSFLPYGQCDTFDVYYFTGPTLGTFNISRTGDTTSGNIATVSGTTGYGMTTFTGAMGNVNSININYVGSGSVYIAGIVGRSSTVKAIQIHNMGWGSATAANWVDNSNGWSPLPALKVFAPDLTIIGPGINEWFTGTTPATFVSNMMTLINAALISGDVYISTAFPSPNNTTATPPYGYATQRTYIDALKAAVAGMANVIFDDFHAQWGPWENQNPFGYYCTGSATNMLHPFALGYRQKAIALAQAFSAI